MEMESDQPDDVGNGIKETLVKPLFDPGTPESPDVSNVFGEQQVRPRVGHEYQVEIPSMIVEPGQYKLLTNPGESKVVDVSRDFLVGLPVPIIWSDEVKNIEDNRLESPTSLDDAVNAKRSQEARNSKKKRIRVRKKISEPKVECLEFGLDQGEESRAESVGPMLVEEDSNKLLSSKCYYPVPDTSRSTWSDAEVNGFLLGLYIFGKNFYKVKRFMEHKDMGEILSFYYGKFYRSDAHCRWSECRKIRKRKCVTGEKIFTGWRHRELLSRLIPHVQEEFQNTLSERYKSFAEGKTSLEEYVSLLKSTVGIRVLVEAIGIGKGKEDLTGLAMEPGKNNQEVPACPKLPTGKAFSSLTLSEILKCLNGGFRLSKGRCNEIFWEAVWPRLLANGWHSEQPKNRGYISFKSSLVFLLPGIKKFSRRKLINGDQYFDSVSDVLNKVASEPELLRLEGEDLVGSWNEEGGSVPEVTSDQDDPSNYQRHCYLKPRVATSNPNRMKFTVVDTSLVHGGKSCGIVELRYSPVEFKTNSKQTNCSRENEGDTCENKLNEYENDTAEKLLNSKTNMAKDLNHEKFTVVDTSLVRGGKSSKVRELRCSPAVVQGVSKLTGLLRETEGNSSVDLVGKQKLDAIDISLNGQVNNLRANCDMDTSDIGGANQMATINNSDFTEKIKSYLDQKTSMPDEKQPKSNALDQLSGRVKYTHSSSIGPLTKRRKRTACVKAETSCVNENCPPDLKSEPHGTVNLLESGELVVSLVGPQEKESSSNSQAAGSPVKESSSETLSGNSSDLHMSHAKNEKRRNQVSSNLALPQDSLDSRNSKNFVGLSQERNADSLPSSGIKHVNETLSTSRRQSTRNRPLTARALEALADGLFTVKKRKKSTEVCIREKPLSSRSRKARRGVEVISSNDYTANGVVAPKEENEENEAFTVTNKVVSKPLDHIGEKWLTGY